MVDPIQRSSDTSYTKQEELPNAKQQLQMLDKLQIYLFFIELWKQEGDIPESDSNSLQGKIQTITKQLQEGAISLSMAVMEIASLVKHFEQKHEVSFPNLHLQDQKNYANFAERVADQIFAFQNFVKHMVKKEDSQISNAAKLAENVSHLGDQVLSGKTNPQEGLAQLTGMIKKVNDELSSLKFPLPITPTAYE